MKRGIAMSFFNIDRISEKKQRAILGFFLENEKEWLSPSEIIKHALKKRPRGWIFLSKLTAALSIAYNMDVLVFLLRMTQVGWLEKKTDRTSRVTWYRVTKKGIEGGIEVGVRAYAEYTALITEAQFEAFLLF